MKKLVQFGLIIILSLLSVSLMGQVPQKINYQAVARNAAGLPIANKQIAVKFTIRTGSSSGSEVFSERHTPWTNSLGTFSAIIGYGTPIYGSFGAINWGTGSKWLQIGVDEHGGTNYVDMGTYEMLSVPYARLAQDVINKNDADADPTNELQTLSISGTQLTISQGNTVTLPSSGGGDNWGTQVVQTDATLSGEGTTANKLKIAQQGAANGQVLKWNGSTWAPADDNTGSGGGAPGGVNNSIQYKSGTSFAGSENFRYSGSDIYLEHPSVWPALRMNGGASPDFNQGSRLLLCERWCLEDVGINKHLRIRAYSGGSYTNTATPFVINHNSGNVDIGEITSITSVQTASKLRVEAANDRAIMAGNNSGSYPTAFFKNTNSSGTALKLENTATNFATLIAQNLKASAPVIIAKRDNGDEFFRVVSFAAGNEDRGEIKMTGDGRRAFFRTQNVYGNVGAAIWAGDNSLVHGIHFGYYATGNYSSLIPETDNRTRLGELGRKWTAVYAVNGTIQTSDERDKSAIQDLNYGLQSVLKLRPISFQWKNEGNRFGTGTNLGFSAQELQKVIPDAVVAEKGKTPEDADHTYYGVKYAEIIPVLVKAIQELEQMLGQATGERKELEQKLEQVTGELHELKQFVKDQQK